MTYCPYCGAQAADVHAEIAHMRDSHPDELARRRAALGYDDESPARRAERATWVAGVQHGIDVTLGMVATAYGLDAAERLRDTALAYGEMLKNDPDAR